MKAKYRNLQKELAELGTLRLDFRKVVAIVQLFNQGLTVNSVQRGIGSERLQSLGFSTTNFYTLQGIYRQLPQHTAVLSKYDAFKLASESSEEDTDRVIEQAEDYIIDTINDALGIQGILESRNDPKAVKRLKDMQRSESLVRPEWKTLQHMENIGYPTKQALVFLENLYRLEASRFRAEYQGTEDSAADNEQAKINQRIVGSEGTVAYVKKVNNRLGYPHRLGEFTGRERLMEMYCELAMYTQNPNKSVAKPVTYGLSEIPLYIAQTVSKLWIEGLRGREERMIKASQGLSAFAVWRGIEQKADLSEGLDGQTLFDMTSEASVQLINENKKPNIFMQHYYDSLRNYSSDATAHKNFIKQIESMLAQQFVLSETEASNV